MPKSTNPLLKRKTPSSSRNTSIPKRHEPAQETEDTSEKLPSTGLPPSLAPKHVSQDVETLIRHIHAHTWTPIPDRAAGMGSARVSEILRFRARLPRVVSWAHLLALSVSSTGMERELAGLVARGRVRRIVVRGRGKGGTAVGEGVVLGEDWRGSVRESVGVSEEGKGKYVALLEEYPGAVSAPVSSMSNDEVRELVSAGYFTLPTALSSTPSNLFAPPGSSTLANLSLSGTKAATGTLDAVGGLGALHESGGGGSALATASTRLPRAKGQEITFSLPGTGAYLKLLIAARQHLLALLKQISPRFQESTYEFLKEKWDGNVPNDAASRAKRARGEWSGVLPGKTRKWREFYGLEFEWVLGECVGSGLVEVFETGAVGWGVRVV